MLGSYPWPSYEWRGRHRGPEDWIIWRVPIARLFALYSALCARHGCEPKGQTYVQKAMLKAKRRVEEAAESGATF